MFEVHIQRQKQKPVIVIRQATIHELHEYEKRKLTYTSANTQEKKNIIKQ